MGRQSPAIDAGELPWAYGEDRITAIVRDPDSAFLYWEATDEGIAAARARLGPAGRDGWLDLRIYDTTGRVARTARTRTTTSTSGSSVTTGSTS